MARDSLFGESILWTGRPTSVSVPMPAKLIATGLGVVSVVSICFALVVGAALHLAIGGLVVFSAWCATLALAALRLPLWWNGSARYLITEKHVIWQRGRLRRSIERASVSYALIRWNPAAPGRGDLILIRAVPTGALRRTLRLSLSDLDAPDRIFALVRGVIPGAPVGQSDRPLAQRLDTGERVLWTATPQASPWTWRRGASAALSAVLGAAAIRAAFRSVPPVRRVVAIHALNLPEIVLLISGVSLAVLLLATVAVGIAYMAWVRPGSLARQTRYIVTDTRVLIRRGAEELSLDRSRIAYVICAPSGGLHDVFLVLDGPRARAFAPSGAFGGGDTDVLKPVFASIQDADSVSAILANSAETAPLKSAA